MQQGPPSFIMLISGVLSLLLAEEIFLKQHLNLQYILYYDIAHVNRGGESVAFDAV